MSYDLSTLTPDDLPVAMAVVTFDGLKLQVETATELFCDLFAGNSSTDNGKIDITTIADFPKFYRTFSSKVTVADRFSLTTTIVKQDEVAIKLRIFFKTIKKTDALTTLTMIPVEIGSKADTSSGVSKRVLEIATGLCCDYLLIYEYSMKKTITYSIKNETLCAPNVYDDFYEHVHQTKLLHEDDMEEFDKYHASVVDAVPNAYCELRVIEKQTGLQQWHSVNSRTVYNDDGTPKTHICTIKNISANKESELKLIDKAERDPLTKIYNKATTNSLIKGYLRTDSKENFDALIIIDVDNFKAVNDNLGHLFGDSVLVDLSQEMQDLFRTSDVVGRIGGDEFLVFLRGVKQKKHIADKAADICRIFELLYSGENGDRITGSIGVSIFPQDGETYDELFQKADVALYHSKGKGKNCYSFYEDCKDELIGIDAKAIETNRYKRDLPISSYSNDYNSVLTDFAFDIMNKTKDVSSAIVMLLSKVGKHFGLSRVSIMEVVEQTFTMKYTYQWCDKNIDSQIGMTILKNRDQWVKSLESYDENDICCITNIDLVVDEIDEYTLQIYKNGGTKALIECAIFDSGEFRGHVSFADCNKNREWSMDEVKILKTISKIVSSYLLKMRAFERANALVDRLTNYDQLTELPKINIFKQYASEYLSAAEIGDRFALIYLDFNNFKFVNEKLGSENGDRLLISLSDGLLKINENLKCSARVYSDKFVMFTKLDDDEDIVEELTRYVDIFTGKERFKNPDCPIAISSGIYIINNPQHADINKAIDNANIARKQAKNMNENNCILYKDKMKLELNATLEIANEAEQAIVNNEFVVYYQPKINIQTEKITGAEALIRWCKPDGKIIPPNTFIPYLEKSGFIVTVDFYVYEKVCRFLRDELDKGNEILPISLNVSRMHVSDSTFVRRIQSLVTKYRIPPEFLEFELTENAFLEDQTAAINIIGSLRELGFHVSIDDFGSGYSSLSMLRMIPVDVMKMDRSFFINSKLDGNDGIIIQSIIEMAKRMKMEVVCEGIEDEEQVNFLKSTNCDTIQGYYYARPMPQSDYLEYKERMI